MPSLFEQITAQIPAVQTLLHRALIVPQLISSPSLLISLSLAEYFLSRQSQTVFLLLDQHPGPLFSLSKKWQNKLENYVRKGLVHVFVGCDEQYGEPQNLSQSTHRRGSWNSCVEKVDYKKIINLPQKFSKGTYFFIEQSYFLSPPELFTLIQNILSCEQIPVVAGICDDRLLHFLAESIPNKITCLQVSNQLLRVEIECEQWQEGLVVQWTGREPIVRRSGWQ